MLSSQHGFNAGLTLVLQLSLPSKSQIYDSAGNHGYVEILEIDSVYNRYLIYTKTYAKTTTHLGFQSIWPNFVANNYRALSFV